jgi:type I restriction enzyme S subunit
MTLLPPGWSVQQLGDVATTALGKMLDRGKARGHSQVPYLRNVNVQWGRIDTGDVLTMELADDERDRFAVEKGDLLVCEGGEIGRAAIWHGRSEYIAYQKALHRVRPSDAVESRYLLHLLRHLAVSGQLAKHATGTTIAHLPQQQLRRLRIPVPPLEDQRRIVNILEDHLSRLDASVTGLDSASRRAMLLTLTSSMQAITRVGSTTTSRSVSYGDREVAVPRGWQASTVGDEASLVQYGTSSKTSEAADLDAIAVLRMGNLHGGAIVTDKLKYLPRDHPEVASLLLQRGDLLFNRTNSAELVGKSAVFDRDDNSMTFASYLIRVRFGPAVRPAWANLVINSPLGRAYIRSVASQQVGQANVNGTKLKAFPLMLPPLDVQDRLLARHEAVDETRRRLVAQVAQTRQRTSLLRRALLQAAFTGRLTETSSGLDRAEESIT